MPSTLHIHEASRALAGGGIIAYPTEAVWGLGCEPLNEHACLKLMLLKQRDTGKGLILIASGFEQLAPYLADVPQKKLDAALATWPGPATWIVPASAHVPRWLTGGRATLAVRVTAHPVASALCRAYSGALVSTSANVSGRPPARSALQVRARLGHGLDYVLAGELGGRSAPTPIRDLMTGKLLRP
jgi:L-threonylcarbamoyladenylate synthase